MENAKRMTLAEIETLPKASVIWVEYHELSDESGIEFYDILPALVCVPGRDGVICYADKYCVFENAIDAELIKDDKYEARWIWNCEPDKRVIEHGVFVDYYNNCHIYAEKESAKRLLTAITHEGYEIEAFCSSCGLDKESFLEFINGERDLTSDEMQIISVALDLTESEKGSVFAPDQVGAGIVIDINSKEIIG